MKPEDLRLSIAFPSTHSLRSTDMKEVQVTINWRTATLVCITLSLSEFALALSSLQFRPAVQVNFNAEVLTKFAKEAQSLKPSVISFSNVSSQKEPRYVAVAFSELGTTCWTKSQKEKFSSAQVEGYKLAYKGAKIQVNQGALE